MYSIWRARAIFGQEIAGNTRGAVNDALLACLRSFCVHFLPISGHFHSNPNFVDLPMTPLGRKNTRNDFFLSGFIDFST